jgi:hypothetical protein
MRHLSVIVLIVLLVGLPSCKYFKGRGLFGKKADILAVWQAKQDSIRVADSLRKVQDRLMVIENAKLDSARKADADRLALESKYNIIVGSFITPEYAKGLAEVYRKQGYDTKILKMEGSRFELVSAEAHESFRKAVARLKEFQNTVEVDAWMYIKK